MITIQSDSSVIQACELMRRFRTNKVLVVELDEGTPVAVGTVSADDVAMRVVALGLDPGVLTAGDVAAFAPSAQRGLRR